ncbi:uncharacterized protein LY89DRAFT_12205 [Mollisia scopiformis]|uniref:Nineteen complex-related protein 2-domain-containing protein n=1 Tax=Mollisia scopiformis TaxID=149040 RepID=A0A194XVR8_MOLSC|nr:uncharacterized protein LY89DRAFT_12205 [Mollisia scopiformis]KUJ24099.1 hypothetical protein LY89DRAFT_12205 [Mollisia scopiformis]
MKSAFGSKRKARKIQVDENEGETKDQSIANEIAQPPVSSNPVRKPFKKSSLRQSIAFDDLEQDENEQDTNKPTIGRSSSLMKKKKKSTASRLSFGPGEIISGDAAEALEDHEAFTPKKPTLERRVIEGNTFRKSLPYQSLPVRSNEEEDERPTYSKDYLKELKSSTPTTPKDLQALHAAAEDEEMLDASELAGATIGRLEDKSVASSNAAYIPTEAEIKEKKERRARLAHEKDFISLNDDGDDGRQISLLPRKKEKETRLVREDEDLGEGFDEFVDDGRVSLGKKAEREARKRQRKEMADMIHQAEGSSDGESDDSEAERRAAYEAAQTRAGMDGLHKPDEDLDRSTVQIPARITPLPALSECLERLQTTLNSMELELAKRQKQLEESKREKLDIGKREAEVQELLKQAGARYAALKADTSGAAIDPQVLAEAQTSGLTIPMMADRGLESFGNTPIARPNVEDVG